MSFKPWLRKKISNTSYKIEVLANWIESLNSRGFLKEKTAKRTKTPTEQASLRLMREVEESLYNGE